MQQQQQGWMQKCEARFGPLVALALKAVAAHKAGDTATRDKLNREVEQRIAKLQEGVQRELKDYVQRLAVLKTVDPGVVYVVARERYRLTTLVLKAMDRGGLKFDPHKFVASVVGLVRQAEARAKRAKDEAKFSEAAFYAELAKDLRAVAPKAWFQPRPEKVTGELEARGLDKFADKSADEPADEPAAEAEPLNPVLSPEDVNRIAAAQAAAQAAAETGTRRSRRRRQ